jgi:hypothetical protein
MHQNTNEHNRRNYPGSQAEQVQDLDGPSLGIR